MQGLYNVSSNPHARGRMTTNHIMCAVALALLPAALFGVFNFGWRALLVLVLSAGSSVLFEYLFERALKKPVTVRDGSALVTGLLIGMNMPAGIPLWMPVLGSAFAIIIVKQLYGGLGQNFMNPALAARAFLMISFAGYMTDFSVGSGFRGWVDAATGATPLAVLKAGGTPPLANLFFGTTQGTIGETSALLLLLGAAALVILGVIRLRIPVAYLCSFSVFAFVARLASGGGADFRYLLSELLSGGLMLGAWFMATDYVTSPVTKRGQWLYGCFLGVLTAILRLYGSSAEGVSYAILIGNLVVPVIERFTRPTAFGKGGKKHVAA